MIKKNRMFYAQRSMSKYFIFFFVVVANEQTNLDTITIAKCKPSFWNVAIFNHTINIKYRAASIQATDISHTWLKMNELRKSRCTRFSVKCALCMSIFDCSINIKWISFIKELSHFEFNGEIFYTHSLTIW